VCPDLRLRSQIGSAYEHILRYNKRELSRRMEKDPELRESVENPKTPFAAACAKAPLFMLPPGREPPAAEYDRRTQMTARQRFKRAVEMGYCRCPPNSEHLPDCQMLVFKGDGTDSPMVWHEDTGLRIKGAAKRTKRGFELLRLLKQLY
jgi:hypothetical protein